MNGLKAFNNLYMSSVTKVKNKQSLVPLNSY